MKKAFTIIELVVAIALMVIVVSFSGKIFKVSIDAHRVTAANAEIMQKMRAITDQLNTDFRGLRKNAPLLIRFFRGSNDRRFDQIMFFADGDFQSTQLYDFVGIVKVPSLTGTPVKGNVARIDYGLDQSLGMLGSRRHILTADLSLDRWLDAQNVVDSFNAPDEYGRGKKNELYEHDSLSLAQWETIGRGAYADTIRVVSFQSDRVKMADPNTYHKLVCDSVDSFAIQWAYWDPYLKRLLWFASDNPNNDDDKTDSQFDITGQNEFGVFFNIPGTVVRPAWFAIKDNAVQYSTGNFFPSNFYPKALKFTFKIFDSKGIIEKGKTFTHIVYIGD